MVDASKAGSGNDATGLQETRQLARLLLRAVWTQQWIAANPDASKDQRVAAWQEAREQVLKSNLPTYRKALTVLRRTGVTMALPARAAGAGQEDEDGED